MNKNWLKDYPSPQGLTEESLDANSSLKKMLDLIGQAKKVVDFGCATGYFASLLQKKDCLVTGIEINPDAAKIAEKYCEKVIVADLDFVSIPEILPNEKFDVAIFGDILEHLRNPWQVLAQTKSILKEYGFVVASIPNITHGAIRLALLEGKFEYKKLGILDDTHLRFFTRETLGKLFENTGYFIDVIDRTKLPVFSESELVPQLHESNYSQEVIQYLHQDQDIDTLQFIVRAFPLSPEGEESLLKTTYQQLLVEHDLAKSQLQKTQTELEISQSQLQKTQTELQFSQSQLQQTQTELNISQSQLQQTQAELNISQSQLQQTQAELNISQSQLQQTQAELHISQSQLQQTQAELHISQSQLQQTQAELNISQSQLQQTQAELHNSQEIIKSVEISKFWKIRNFWFAFRKIIGLSK
jgi:O-antigen biosynthesis protein